MVLVKQHCFSRCCKPGMYSWLCSWMKAAEAMHVLLLLLVPLEGCRSHACCGRQLTLTTFHSLSKCSLVLSSARVMYRCGSVSGARAGVHCCRCLLQAGSEAAAAGAAAPAVIESQLLLLTESQLLLLTESQLLLLTESLHTACSACCQKHGASNTMLLPCRSCKLGWCAVYGYSYCAWSGKAGGHCSMLVADGVMVPTSNAARWLVPLSCTT